MKKFISIKVQLSGLHRWIGATEFPTVDFLSNLHRHLFYFNLKFQVENSDRELEFFLTSYDVITYLTTKYYDDKYKILNFNGSSCETIAEDLLTFFDADFVSVYEDNENGAEILK